MAQEFLTTFREELGEVSLRPSDSGVFRLTLDGEVLWCRQAKGRFPETKEMKQAIRDRIAPKRDLGHSDR